MSQWFEDKFQEVENEEQQLRKLHAVVDSLVNHRKGELHLPFSTCLCLSIFFFIRLFQLREEKSTLQLPKSFRVKQVD